ncbi:tyrosyl-tRNA synthetase [Desulfacinum hydrothermale DSM 13146]|uniref:Tyrosine--tRNA ligase n=1 Tax=Desulfacinum hydrothermale DSM 13146 TaxID=1121390 RepID=A0A1W1XVK2_9BACT|nr:tyrosine--tRNA ligase [Desulfacinum hydrothermale]SMC27989.1 tyrosyl-tRNA synthetase [Desulfacinum hydrothermale DSM 13146]
MNVLDILVARGFVEQITDAEGVRRHLENPVSCYIGFDPTADSLHVGSLVPILALAHLQRHGHRPIVLVGGGTGMVGDPSGKTEMRKLLTREQIRRNVEALQAQLARFIRFEDGQALILDNGDWLLDLNYIEFLRDIGRHFSVNRMLAAESYRMRLETGLNFIEFNYMLLQAYDFYYLASHYDCFVQMGGNDQWGNIVAGIDLIRRKMSKEAYGITFPLLTTATGAKMGKTAEGAVWLSAEKTSPYEFFQYWVNVDDRDVERFLKLYTFLPLEEIRVVEGLEGRELNACKTILAYEVTRIVHGRQEALKAYEGAAKVFGRRALPADLLPSSSIPRDLKVDEGAAVPSTSVSQEELEPGIPAFELFARVGLCDSKSAARRLIQQGGGYIDGKRIASFDQPIGLTDLKDGSALLRAGKKKVHRICVAG